MAVTVHNTTFAGEAFTPLDFAILMEHVCGHPNGILYGCNVTKTSDTTIKVSEGWAIVRGRLLRIEEGSMNIPLATSGTLTRYVRLKVDLSNASGSASCELSDSAGTDSANFNVDKGIAYMWIAILSITTTTHSISRWRGVLSHHAIIRSGTSAPDNSTGLDGDIYVQY